MDQSPAKVQSLHGPVSALGPPIVWAWQGKSLPTSVGAHGPHGLDPLALGPFLPPQSWQHLSTFPPLSEDSVVTLEPQMLQDDPN